MKKYFLYITLLLWACAKKEAETPVHFNCLIQVKDAYTQKAIPNISVQLLKKTYNLGLTKIVPISTRIADTKGEVLFEKIPFNSSLEYYEIKALQSSNYADSEGFKLDKNTSLLLNLKPLIDQKVIVLKSNSIKKYKLYVSSDLHQIANIITDSASSKSFDVKFVPEIDNQLQIQTYSLDKLHDTIIVVKPKYQDSASIRISL